MSTEFISGISSAVTSLSGDFQDLITGNLTALFGLFATITGVYLIIKLVRRLIGR